MDKGSMSGHNHDMMTGHHSDTGKHMMLNKMEKHRDIVEREYKDPDNDLIDNFL